MDWKSWGELDAMGRSSYASLLKMGKVEEFNAFRRSHPEAVIDLSKFSLDGLSLPGVDLRGANLTHSTLRDTNLQNANLSRTNLSGARLARANLRGADLTKAVLTNADLKKAVLDGCTLREANLDGADLAGTILPKGEMSAAKGEPSARDKAEMESFTERVIAKKKKQEYCDNCQEEDLLPLHCSVAKWPPSSCKRWIEAEMSLSGLFSRIAAERKLIREIPEEDFDDFIQENGTHLILVKWKKNRTKLNTKHDYLQLYAEVLFKLM